MSGIDFVIKDTGFNGVRPPNNKMMIVFQNQKICGNRLEFSSRDPNEKVTGIRFLGCKLKTIPRIPLIDQYFPNLTILDVRSCNFNKVFKDQFLAFPSLKELYLVANQVEYLPSDLFENTLDLEVIVLRGNPVNEVGDGILDPLTKLVYFELGTAKQSIIYDRIKFKGNATLDELKKKLSNFKPCTERPVASNDQDIAPNAYELENKALKEKVKLLEKKIEELYARQSLIYDDYSRNFTIKIGDKKFNVHKAVMKTNSPSIARIIENDPDIDGVELNSIDEKTFMEISNFMYKASPPSKEANLLDLYAACGKLQIEAFMEIVAKKLIDEITPENALEVINLCQLYPNDELKMKAFEKFKENFPGQNLSLDLASQPDKLKKLMALKKEMETVATE